MTCFNWGAVNNDEEKEADSDSYAVNADEVVADSESKSNESKTIRQMFKGCFKGKDKKATSSDEQPVTEQTTPTGTENTDAANQRRQSETKTDIGDMVLEIGRKR